MLQQIIDGIDVVVGQFKDLDMGLGDSLVALTGTMTGLGWHQLTLPLDINMALDQQYGLLW